MASPAVRLNMSGAAISGRFDELNPPISLPNQSSHASLIALDIGGTLIKLVYFSVDEEEGRGGKLNFVKFETCRLDQCLEFIQSKKLLCANGSYDVPVDVHLTIKATGGGSYKFGDIIREKLGVSLDKLDEMDSVVAGANFLLKRISCASFTHMDGKRTPIHINENNLFPYLLVNIGSGVSMIQVIGNQKFKRVTGTHIGGGTMFGLAKLLTGCARYDEFLELSQKGDNLVLDLIVRDICGELVSQEQGLQGSTLASSFGKVASSKRKLSDYRAEDLATTLLSAFTYNIAQVSYLVAALLGLKRVFFGGSYIRGHASTMDNISYAIDFWSKGQMQAVFLRHEGFLGALGAFMSYENMGDGDISVEDLKEKEFFHEPSIPDRRLLKEHNLNSIFPYLLVNIGSGVSMIEVIGKGKYERIIGTHLGGGTIFGLARLLTGCNSYDDFLQLSQKGDNLSVDLTVGDIYGADGYTKHNLPASTTASSFGKVMSNKLADYKPEDLAAALLNAFTYNIGQISYFVAKLSKLESIFFRGAYVCGHTKIMDKISRSLKYWSKDQVQTTFLCHEGFMGALGAFWSYENMGINESLAREFMKQVLLGAPYMGEMSRSTTLGKLYEKNNDMSFKIEIERLQNDNEKLKAEVERLQLENEELKAKLERIHLES